MSRNFNGFWRVTFNNRQPIDLKFNDSTMHWENTSNKYTYILQIESFRDPLVFRKNIHTGGYDLADRVKRISYIMSKEA